MSVYVIDANTVVSAALKPDGIPKRALAAARARGTIALSRVVHAEIVDVLARPKFAGVLTQSKRLEILQLLSVAALWVEPTETVTDCRDLADNHYLALASAARATAIITGDQDLLALHPWRAVRILRPADFLALILSD